MLKGAVASIVIALALFFLYDVSNSYNAPCVVVPAEDVAPRSAAPLVQPPALIEGQSEVAAPPVSPPPATVEICGFNRSITVQKSRIVAAFLNRQQGAVTSVAAILLTILGVIIAFSASAIAGAVRRSADAARRHAESLPRLERGYLFISAIDKSTWVTADKERIMVAVDIRNYGRTPAILTETYGEFLSAAPQVRPAKYPFGDANKQTHAIVLGSGAPAIRLDDRFFGKLVEPVFFLGYVKYRDVFRATHVSCWCLRGKRVGEDGWQWEPAGAPGWDDYD